MSATHGPGAGGRLGAAHREWPADARVLGEIRGTVRAWLGGFGIGEDLCDDLVYATSEAASNSVEHAYRSPHAGSTVEVTLWSEWGIVNVEIADRGSWLPAGSHLTNRGHGLPLIRGLVESVSIESGAGGTTVSLRHPVSRSGAFRAEPARGG
jgi:anti-sigma regulatory factor (Ser/Thr protein kinase)